MAVHGWVSPANGWRHHGWNRDPKPLEKAPGSNGLWRWRCIDCGAVVDKYDSRHSPPTAQDLLNKQIDKDCGVQAAKAVMES